LPQEKNPLRARGDRPKWYSPATLGAVFWAGRDRLALLIGAVLDTGRPGAVVGAGAMTGLHEALEGNDFPLVHTAYYREPDYLLKVADWLCEPVTEEFDGRIRRVTQAPRGAPRGGCRTWWSRRSRA